MNTEAPPEAHESPMKDTAQNRQDGMVLSLPLLHSESPDPLWRSKAPHLWPGLPHMPETGYVELPGAPFSPAQAAACLADLEAMSEAALTGVPLQALAARENRPQARRDADERTALRHFAATGEESAPPSGLRQEFAQLAFTAAQKILLWAWLLEERQREMRALSSSFDAGAGNLMDALGVEEDADLTALHAASMRLGDDAGILPPWKLVLENAALFLPETCTICVNDARMAEAVADQCADAGITPVPPAPLDASRIAEWGLPAQPGMTWCRITLPLWRIVGLSTALEQRPWLNREVQLLLPLPKAQAAQTAGAADPS